MIEIIHISKFFEFPSLLKKRYFPASPIIQTSMRVGGCINRKVNFKMFNKLHFVLSNQIIQLSPSLTIIINHRKKYMVLKQYSSTTLLSLSKSLIISERRNKNYFSQVNQRLASNSDKSEN